MTINALVDPRLALISVNIDARTWSTSLRRNHLLLQLHELDCRVVEQVRASMLTEINANLRSTKAFIVTLRSTHSLLPDHANTRVGRPFSPQALATKRGPMSAGSRNRFRRSPVQRTLIGVKPWLKILASRTAPLTRLPSAMRLSAAHLFGRFRHRDRTCD